MSLRHVRQKHQRGCAVAAVAMLADIPYDLALTLLQPHRKRGGRINVNIDHITFALLAQGIGLKQVWQPLTSLPGHALVLVDPNLKTETELHGVVWDAKRQRILDPNGEPAPHSRRWYEHRLYQIFLTQTHYHGAVNPAKDGRL